MSTTLSRRDIEELLPWYAAGTLDPAETQQVEAALIGDPDLQRKLALTREEMGETVLDAELLGTPSPKALDRLLTMIEAEPQRRPTGAAMLDIGQRLAAWLSPRTLGWAAAVATLIVAIQAGVITARLVPGGGGQFTTASQEPATTGGTFAIIGFQPGATAEAIGKALDGVKGSIVEGPRPGGLYRVRIGPAGMSKEAAGKTLAALKAETGVIRIVLPSD